MNLLETNLEFANNVEFSQNINLLTRLGVVLLTIGRHAITSASDISYNSFILAHGFRYTFIATQVRQGHGVKQKQQNKYDKKYEHFVFKH